MNHTSLNIKKIQNYQGKYNVYNMYVYSNGRQVLGLMVGLPAVIFARVFADAGAKTTALAHLLNSMCNTVSPMESHNDHSCERRRASARAGGWRHTHDGAWCMAQTVQCTVSGSEFNCVKGLTSVKET